jgi:hypothetical protein
MKRDRISVDFAWAVVLVATAASIGGCGKRDAALDLSDPRKAAVSFTRALERGDAAIARQAAIYGGLEGDLVDAMAVLAQGITRLRAAATTRFGEDALHKIEPGAMPDVSSRLERADVKLDGDVATVTPTSGTSPMRLKKTADGWKVDIGALIRGSDVTRLIPTFKAMGESAGDVAAQIEGGKLASIDAARDALQQGVFRRISPARVVPATAPTTAPATTTTTTTAAR